MPPGVECGELELLVKHAADAHVDEQYAAHDPERHRSEINAKWGEAVERGECQLAKQHGVSV